MAPKLIWFKVYPSDTIMHYSHGLDYDALALGIKMLLWCHSFEEDPVGTVPDDLLKWSRWTGYPVADIETRKDKITSSWHKENGRWHIRRIIEANTDAQEKSSNAVKAARARWSGDADGNASAMQTHKQMDMQTQCHPKAKAKARATSNSKAKTKEQDKSIVQNSEAEILDDSVDRSLAELEKEIQQVYTHYLAATGNTKASYRMTQKRRSKIKTRLGEVSPDAICVAIDACLASDWHTGNNPQQATYIDLADNILRSYEQMEKWIKKGVN